VSSKRFDDVEATRYRPNPAHVLDFRRFCSDELLARYREQRDMLARHAPRVRRPPTR
jgi:beta-galactosidase